MSSSPVMLRRLATLVLLVPLSLNGLWMLCAEEQAVSEPVDIAAGTADVDPDCAKICPLHQPETGVICLISSNGDGISLAAILFVVAPPPAAENLNAALVVRESVPEKFTKYSNPSLAGLTPPPRA
jgi:hypothetical protein